MPSTTAYLSNKSSPFFRLPTEIRHDVYCHVFPCSTFRLKEQAGGASGPTALSSSAVALLITCYAIHHEAIPIFYREARIHFSMSWRNPTKSINMTAIRLPLVVHISIDFCCLGLTEEYGDVSDRFLIWLNKPAEDDCECPTIEIKKAMDRQIAECIDSISTNCPLLRSFTLHLLSSDCGYDPENVLNDVLQEALDSAEYCGRPSKTIDSLKKLKVRDSIVVVAVAIDCIGRKNSMYRNIREAIKPSEEWGLLVLGEWPGISLTGEQHEEVKLLKEYAEDDTIGIRESNAEIRLWYYQPPGSKALVLPDHKLLENELSRDGTPLTCCDEHARFPCVNNIRHA